MKIYIITHKKYNFPVHEKIYEPLLVGADFHDDCFGYCCDNDFEGNISYKNKSFCELTGLWKIYQTPGEGIVGLCHYRRYFTKHKRFFQKSGILKENEISSILSNYDTILPIRGNNEYNGKNAKEFFNEKHDPQIWDICNNIIKEKYPEFIPDFDWFAEQNIGYCYNMFIMKKNLLNEYCKWLFSILFELERRSDISKYNNYNQRMYGFVSERLINVWVHHKNLKVKEEYIYNPEGPGLVTKAIRKIRKRIKE